MPIPDYPENRGEQYLNRIATGEGDIPAYPENRTEQYLDAIARNGGGGSSGGGVLMIESDEALGSYNKTFREVGTAFLAGTPVIWCSDAINGLYYLMVGYDVLYLTVMFSGGNTLIANSEDGYLYLPD